MEDIPSDPGKLEAPNPNTSWWPSDLTGKLRSVSLMPEEQNLGAAGSASNAGQELSPRAASQILWSTGTLSSPIPNGFYSIIPDKKLKELFDTIPSPEDLHSLGIEGLKAEIILVDADKDKKLSMLKQLSAALVKGLSSNPASLIKKLAGLVSDFYKRPNLQLSPAKATVEEIAHLMENRGIQLLGQIRHGSCRPRAILFKVLADSVGLESKLMVGLPGDESVEYTDSYKHMSVVVVLNSMELLVDLMRFPGQLVPFSAKAIFTSHISASGESDSADYDSCDSPLEPNSPLCSFYDRIDGESKYKARSQANLLYGLGYESQDGFCELKRGPRGNGFFKNQKPFGPLAAVKGLKLPSTGNEDSRDVPNKEQFNREDFAVKYSDAKIFIIKSSAVFYLDM